MHAHLRPLVVAVLLGMPLETSQSQDPVVKPRVSARRLAGPRAVVGRQLPDGRIEVQWTRVAGAERYTITRSVPNLGAGPVGPDPTDTVYVDADVRQGYYYYYVVQAVDSAGGIGLKTGSAPVIAQRSASGASTTAAVSALNASLMQTGSGAWLNIPRVARKGTQLLFERTMPADPHAGWVMLDKSTMTTTMDGGGVNAADSWTGIPDGTRLRWRVTAVDVASGTRSTPVLSNELTTGATTSTTGSGGSSATGLAGGSPMGSVLVSVAAPYAVRIGASTSLAAALDGSTALRWLSLDEGVATVDAIGGATGRGAGSAQVLAIGRGANGSVRITSVQVNVSP